ncbi:condensation domain-containing protein, partial [Streptomyces yangpuensis]
DFFELGGHSLLATQAVSRMRDVFEVEIPLRTMFENPTVEGIAQVVDGGGRAAHRTPMARVDSTVGAPLSLQQMGLWHSAYQLSESFASYNIPIELWLHGDLDVEALERSLVDLVGAHDILRTTFPERDGAPVQIVGPHVDFTLPTTRTTRAEVAGIAREQALQPFSLKTERPWRSRLLILEDGDQVLLITLHHILTDGWSMDELTRQLGARYALHTGSAGTGADGPAPQEGAVGIGSPDALPVQYADYAAWQHEWLHGEEARQQAEYWAQQLHEIRPLWDRRIDPAHAELYRGVRHRFSIPAETAHALRLFAKSNNATLYMAMLTGFMLLLSEMSDKDDIAVGTPVAGRTRSELNELIGYFAHIVLLRTDLSGTPAFTDALQRVRETVISAFANQEVSISSVARELESKRYRGRVSLFQAHFSLTHESVRSSSFGDLDLRFEFTRVPNPFANIDLELEVFERGESLDAWLIYNEGMFDPGEIAGLTEQLLALYERMAAQAPIQQHIEQSRNRI